MALTTPTRPTPTTDRPEAADHPGRKVGAFAVGIAVLAAGAMAVAAVVARDDAPARDVTPLLVENGSSTPLDRVTSRVEPNGQVAESNGPSSLDRHPE